MYVRHKKDGMLAYFSGYNLHGLGEFIAVHFDGSKSSEMIKDWEAVEVITVPWPREED